MSYQDIITIEPGKRGGKPCIRGMRITVYDVLEYLASGMTQAEILIFRTLQKKIFLPVSVTLQSMATSLKQPNPNRACAILFARLVLGLIFFMAGVWKVFQLGPLEHARKYFLPFSDTFLPT